jgi:hypothetical protein
LHLAQEHEVAVASFDGVDEHGSVLEIFSETQPLRALERSSDAEFLSNVMLGPNLLDHVRRLFLDDRELHYFSEFLCGWDRERKVSF